MLNLSIVKRHAGLAALMSIVVLLAGCATIDASAPPVLKQGEKIALLPIQNLTQTPQVGDRVESIVESLLQAGGRYSVKRYTGDTSSDQLFADVNQEMLQQATAKARAQNVKYGLTGSVQEWRYKVGVDGEPAVGISLKLIDLQTGEVVWTATGSKTGWSRSAVSAIGQTLLRTLLSPLL